MGWAQGDEGAPAVLDDGWPVASLQSAGFDPAAIAALTDMIDADVLFPNVHALLIAHQGQLVFERYWSGENWIMGDPIGVAQHGPSTLHDLRSVSKSITGLLMGVALGAAAPEALSRPIASFFPQRQGLGAHLEDITLRHVLTMTAGLAWNEALLPYSNERNDFHQLVLADDPVGYVLGKEARDSPGEVWTYNSGLTDVAAAVIEALTATPLRNFADEVLFKPLGISDVTFLRPPAWPAAGIPNASARMRMRARDLAKIGTMVLQGGLWQGRQIVPADWIATATDRHVAHTWNPMSPYGYGFYWYPGRLISGHRVVSASGYGDQRIYVLPDLNLSVTLFAGNYEAPSVGMAERLMGRIVRAQG